MPKHMLPHFRGREAITTFADQVRRETQRPVLLVPTPSEDAPLAPLPGFLRKTLCGVVLPPQIVGHSSKEVPDVPILHALHFNQQNKSAESGAGAFYTQTPAGYLVDLMAMRPDKVRGQGVVAIVDAVGWQPEGFDPNLVHLAESPPDIPTGPARYTHAIGDIAVLGLGVVSRDDLGAEIRKVSDPSMEHHQTPPVVIH